MTESIINKEPGAWSRNPAVVQQPREQYLETTSIRFYRETVCTGKVMLFFPLTIGWDTGKSEDKNSVIHKAGY